MAGKIKKYLLLLIIVIFLGVTVTLWWFNRIPEGRAVFASDDDWWNLYSNRPRGDLDHTIETIKWLEEGKSHVTILVCGTLDEKDLINNWWEEATTIKHAFVFEKDCSGRLSNLLKDKDIVVIEYATTSWDLPIPQWSRKDMDALFKFYENDGRILVMDDFGYMKPLFEAFFISPEDVSTKKYRFIKQFDLYDGKDHIGKGIFVTGFKKWIIF